MFEGDRDDCFEQCVVPKRFWQPIVIHIVGNLSRNIQRRHPLIIGIHGPPGQGKTFQCNQILHRLKVETIELNALDMESDHSGEPARRLIDTYLHASELIDSNRCVGASIIINDIDLGVGSFSPLTQFTVNTQHLVKALMEIADDPSRACKAAVRRVPIIVTGNNIATLYAPLRRSGRMRLMYWRPTREEMAQVLMRSVFRKSRISYDDAVSLIDEFGDQPLSFFSDIEATLFDRNVLRVIEEHGLDEVIEHVALEGIAERDSCIGVEELVAVGARILKYKGALD